MSRHIMILVLLFLFCANALQGQFRDLVATSEGSSVFFISRLGQRGANQHPYDKVFVLDDAGVRLAALPPMPPSISPSLPGYSMVGGLQESSDGGLLLYAIRSGCGTGSSCSFREPQTTLRAVSGTEVFSGLARFSRDGRWLVRYAQFGGFPTTLTDRRTNATRELRPEPGGGRPFSFRAPPTVTPDGRVLIADEWLVLWEKDSWQPIVRMAVQSAVMDDRASTVVYQPEPQPLQNRRLLVVDVESTSTWPLCPPDRDCYKASLSSDGQTVMYLAKIGETPQLFVSSRDGTNWRQLTNEETGIAEAALSGNGRVIWATTGSGAILRINSLTGDAEPRLGPTAHPAMDGADWPFFSRLTEGAAGSAYAISGRNLSQVTAVALPPLPEALEGVEVLVSDGPILIQAVSPSRILFQIPWETPLRPQFAETTIRLRSGDSPFEAVALFAVKADASSSETQPVWIHEDFTSLVNLDSPAVAGETVHLYTTGLGPVNPHVGSGQATPSDPLSLLEGPWAWEWQWAQSPLPGRTPAQVPFAGLAPGLIGFYQVDVGVPLELTSDTLRLAVWRPRLTGIRDLGEISVRPNR